MPTYPETPAYDISDVLHGETIADLYRWLEDGEAPETRAWTERQNALYPGLPLVLPGNGFVAPGGTPGHRCTGRPFPGEDSISIFGGKDPESAGAVLASGADGEDRVAVDPECIGLRRRHGLGLVLSRARMAGCWPMAYPRTAAKKRLQVLDVDTPSSARPDFSNARGFSGLAARGDGILLHPVSGSGRGPTVKSIIIGPSTSISG